MGRVAVIGGGAAGMFAAAAAAANGHQVDLLEKNEKLGKKLYITGKGRCNLTNSCDMETLFENVCSNRKFLYSAFYGFSNQDTIAFFEGCGLRTKVERGNRVFPYSDHASDVIAALAGEMKRRGVRVHLRTEVQEILTELETGTAAGAREGPGAAHAEERKSEVAGGAQEGPGAAHAEVRKTDVAGAAREDPGAPRAVRRAGEAEGKPRVRGVRLTDGRVFAADAVIVATGGLSYPTTGSTGDGYRFARELGHTVTGLSPALVPLEVAEEDAARMQGLSLRNVKAAVLDGKKVLYEAFGEMMFTHFGVTGPLILSASSQIQKHLNKHPLLLKINLKPALSPDQMEARLLREFDENKNRQFKNALGALYPAKMIPVIIQRSGISPEKAVHDISREERQTLAAVTREFTLTVTGLRDYNEAIITRGGVAVKEIRPQTMESRLVSGLHFAGEVLDVDALTGGFNLQIAWSTGYAAGRGVCGG